MALDSDILHGDDLLSVRFYNKVSNDSWNGKPFIEIISPGDKFNIVDQPVNESHKRRWPSKWLHFSMGPDVQSAIFGTPLRAWHEDDPLGFNAHQLDQMIALRFQSVEQVANANDTQLQRVGMGAVGMRESARRWLENRNRSQANVELDKAKEELAVLQAQVAELLAAKRGPGRPKKEASDGDDNAAAGAAVHQ